MNTLNKLASSFQKVGSLLPNNPLAQEAINYGAGAALGIGGQQLMNWATPGADPNPLLSGLMYAPIGAKVFRGGVPNGAIAKAALDASNIAAYGGAATSIYNVATDGVDYDNNLISAGAGTLGVIAPIAYSLIKKGRPMVNESVGNSRNPVNPRTGYQGSPDVVVTSKVETPQPQKRPFDQSRELEGIKRFFYGDSIGNSMWEPKNPKTGYYG